MYRERSMSLAHPRSFQKSSFRVIGLTALCGEESLLRGILLSVPSEWIPMIQRVYVNVYEASGYNETAKHSLSRLAKCNWAHKKWNGNAWAPLHRSRNEFSLRVAQSVLVGLRGLSGLTLISTVTIRIFYSNQLYKPTISENRMKLTRLNASERHRLSVTKRRACQ